MASEKSTDEAGSRYNKGTIRGDPRHLVASKDVRRHRLISISYISHGRCHGRVPSSSLVVPAISFQALTENPLPQRRHKKGPKRHTQLGREHRSPYSPLPSPAQRLPTLRTF